MVGSFSAEQEVEGSRQREKKNIYSLILNDEHT